MKSYIVGVGVLDDPITENKSNTKSQYAVREMVRILDTKEIVWYSIGVTQPITPNEPLPTLPEIPRGAVVVVEGRAPIWRYGFAFHLLHGSAAGAIAVYDPKIGAVIVASHSPGVEEGDVLDIKPYEP